MTVWVFREQVHSRSLVSTFIRAVIGDHAHNIPETEQDPRHNAESLAVLRRAVRVAIRQAEPLDHLAIHRTLSDGLHIHTEPYRVGPIQSTPDRHIQRPPILIA